MHELGMLEEFLRVPHQKVSELKAHLSRYLRMASRGTQILVQDRDEPIAQLGPPHASAGGWRERMVQEGRLRAGSQAWSELAISKPERPIDIQSVLTDVREDRNEVRRH